MNYTLNTHNLQEHKSLHQACWSFNNGLAARVLSVHGIRILWVTSSRCLGLWFVKRFVSSLFLLFERSGYNIVISYIQCKWLVRILEMFIKACIVEPFRGMGYFGIISITSPLQLNSYTISALTALHPFLDARYINKHKLTHQGKTRWGKWIPGSWSLKWELWLLTGGYIEWGH